jgi:hypothetical protein
MSGAARIGAVDSELEFKMVDRRLVTDVGLALLIVLPSALPAAPNPWNANNEVGKPSSAFHEARQVRVAEGIPKSGPRYGRS